MAHGERFRAATDLPDASTGRRPPAPVGTLGPLPAGSWKPLGPAPIGPPFLGPTGGNRGGPVSGRVDSVAVVRAGAHAGRVVIGTAGGGIWTSDDNGGAWSPRSDQAPSLAIGAVADDPSRPDHLIAGTGESFGCRGCYPGFGILSSTDGGTTWTVQNPGGVFTGRKVAQVAIDPVRPDHMFAATDGGLFITTNGGTTWARPTNLSYRTNLAGNVTAVVIDPTNPATVYAGGAAKAVAKSSDGGRTWSAANAGITVPSQGFIALGLAASSPGVLYASVGTDGPAKLYKTTNGGATWTLTAAPDFTSFVYAYGAGASPGSQGTYDNTVAVDPTNPDHVVAGGITAIETTDGGATWVNVNGKPFEEKPESLTPNDGNSSSDAGTANKVHPDFHGLAFRPDAKVWLGCDGGMFLYDPGASPATNVTDENGNLNTIQFYSGFGEVDGTVLAGAQDNSSARTTSATLSPWTGIEDGDGGSSAITPNSPSTQFVEANEELLVTTDAFSSDLRDITPPEPLFLPPMIVVANTATPSQPTVYYGGKDLWQTSNPTAEKPTWTQRTFIGKGVSAIAAAPFDPNVVYVGFETGTIEVSTDGGATFSALATQPFKTTYVTGISVDPTNSKAITVSVSTDRVRSVLSNPHVGQFQYKGAPGAGTWKVITGNLPAKRAVSRVVYANGALIAATDAGVYATASVAGRATSWSLLGTELPAVQVQDLFVDGTQLYAVTHGRGAWKVEISPAPPIPCTTTTTGNVTGPVVVAFGQHSCFVNATVSGGMEVNSGGELTVTNSSVSGGITSNGARAVDLCSNVIGPASSGPALSVTNTTGPIRVGDPATGCNGNAIAGDVSLTNNVDGLVFGSNSVQGSETVDANQGGSVLLRNNVVTGTLSCVGNNPPPTNNGNANTAGSKTFQCGGL